MSNNQTQPNTTYNSSANANVNPNPILKPTVPIAVISSNFGSGGQNNNIQYINSNSTIISNTRSVNENQKSSQNTTDNSKNNNN